MPLFQYKAIGADGRSIKGVVDADSLRIAKERLRKEQVLVTSIGSLQLQGKALQLKPQQLQSFTRELAQLLKAGLPLYESLLTIEEKQRGTPVHPLFADLCDKLKTGMSFSNGLSKYPGTFNEIYLSMVRSAEASGSLFSAFDQLSILIAKQQKLKKQLVSALAYPAFLGGFCFLVIIALFFFVIPSMKELFEDRVLHPLTALVIFLSNFLNTHLTSIVTVLSVSIASAVFAFRAPAFRGKMGEVLLKTPYIKKILLESALVRLFRSMYMLLEGGVPLVDALGYSRKMVGSMVLEDVLSKTEKEITEGKKLSQLFAESPYIPPLVIRMLAIGEETGTMPSMMRSIAEIYEEELDKDLQQLMTFLQPAVLLFLGAVVGLVVLAILLPLTDVSSFVSS
jgi:general secretion pathway protein F